MTELGFELSLQPCNSRLGQDSSYFKSVRVIVGLILELYSPHGLSIPVIILRHQKHAMEHRAPNWQVVAVINTRSIHSINSSSTSSQPLNVFYLYY